LSEPLYMWTMLCVLSLSIRSDSTAVVPHALRHAF